MTKFYQETTRCLKCYQLFKMNDEEDKYCEQCEPKTDNWLSMLIQGLAITLQQSIFP